MQNRILDSKNTLDLLINEDIALNKKQLTAKILLIASFIMAVILAIVVVIPNNKYLNENVLYININPSIELTIANDYKVLNQRALNKEAAMVLFNETMIGLDYDIAIKKIIQITYEVGFLNDNGDIEFEVINQDQNTEDLMITALNESVRTYLNENEINANVKINIDENLREEAKKYQVSVSKLNLIYEVIEQYPEYQVSDLLNEKIQRIKNLLVNYNEEELNLYEDEIEEKLKTQINNNQNQAIIAQLYVIQNELNRYEVKANKNSLSNLDKTIEQFNNSFSDKIIFTTSNLELLKEEINAKINKYLNTGASSINDLKKIIITE